MPRRYPLEFRTEAVRLVETSNESIRVLAADLGVAEQTLRNWVKQAKVDAGQRSGLTSEDRFELQRLRRENRLLREERNILKKAAAFFARESEPIR
jgi:transposase